MENTTLAKQLNRYAAIFSAVVVLFVIFMRQIPIERNLNLYFLPPFHAFLNTCAMISLIYALIQIKQKNIEGHRKAIYVAMSCSLVFLVSYVVYHLTTPETKYCGEGAIRGVYFFVLATHIFLAATSLPFILFTFIRGYTNQVEKHRKMAKWVYWIWLYVTLTGPVCYLMLRPCYVY